MTGPARRIPDADVGELADTAIIRRSLGTVAQYPDFPAAWAELDALAQLWSAHASREAVLLASPVLAGQVDKLLSFGR